MPSRSPAGVPVVLTAAATVIGARTVLAATAPVSAPPGGWVAVGLLGGVLVAAAWARWGPAVPRDPDAVADRVAARLDAGRRDDLVVSTRLDARLEALGSDIGRLTGLVRALETDRAEQFGSLSRHLEETLRTTAQLSSTTRDLSRVLANDRARGQWGERMAEDVLRAAGLVEGVNYVVRRRLPSGGVPDVTLLLPQGRCLHMDVKFPLANHLRYLRADTDEEAARHRSAFLRDARQRVLEIARRDYLGDGDGLGVALLLIPNESVFSFLQQEAPDLFDEAMAAGISVCSPLTLFAVLAVVRQAVDAAHLAESSEEIRRCLDAVERQWRWHTGAVDKLGTHLRHALRAHDDLAGPGRRRMDDALAGVARLRQGPLPQEPVADSETTAGRSGEQPQRSLRR